jgi:hypothetical protein
LQLQDDWSAQEDALLKLPCGLFVLSLLGQIVAVVEGLQSRLQNLVPKPKGCQGIADQQERSKRGRSKICYHCGISTVRLLCLCCFEQHHHHGGRKQRKSGAAVVEAGEGISKSV